jgi:hypothetical protein
MSRTGLSLSVEQAPEASTAWNGTESGHDPFVGFTMSAGQRERIGHLEQTVAELGNIDDALQTLRPGEADLSIVKDTLKQYELKQTFESVHTAP